MIPEEMLPEEYAAIMRQRRAEVGAEAGLEELEAPEIPPIEPMLKYWIKEPVVDKKFSKDDMWIIRTRTPKLTYIPDRDTFEKCMNSFEQILRFRRICRPLYKKKSNELANEEQARLFFSLTLMRSVRGFEHLLQSSVRPEVAIPTPPVGALGRIGRIFKRGEKEK